VELFALSSHKLITENFSF